eukprot:894598-Amorphochlora_amoeboformis.AAC.1
MDLIYDMRTLIVSAVMQELARVSITTETGLVVVLAQGRVVIDHSRHSDLMRLPRADPFGLVLVSAEGWVSVNIKMRVCSLVPSSEADIRTFSAL